MSNMILKPRTRAGISRVSSLSMYDTNKLLYGNGITKRRKVAYRAKYKGNFSGGGTGSARTTKT